MNFSEKLIISFTKLLLWVRFFAGFLVAVIVAILGVNEKNRARAITFVLGDKLSGVGR